MRMQGARAARYWQWTVFQTQAGGCTYSAFGAVRPARTAGSQGLTAPLSPLDTSVWAPGSLRSARPAGYHG
jgi:hypothetical protein